jgi:hypothetical protein
VTFLQLYLAAAGQGGERRKLAARATADEQLAGAFDHRRLPLSGTLRRRRKSDDE